MAEEHTSEGRLPGCDVEAKKPFRQDDSVPEVQKVPRFRSINRSQMFFHPMDIEALIPEDHEVRAIWDLVGSLDLSGYYDNIDSVEGSAGAPAFDPHLLISLWVYAYSKGVSSAREITRLSEYDPAFQWLTGARPVNYHTLADFRSTHGDALRQLFIEVLAMLSKAGLITMERVMHDGTRIRAHAGRDTFRKEEAIREHLARAEGQVKAMEEASEEETTPRIKKARERAAKERKERLSRAMDELKEMKSQKRSTEPRVSATDPECRIMGQSDGGYAPSYNVQISTDARQKAICAVSISQSPADQTLLPSAMDEIKKTTGVNPEQLVVDAGFTTREAIVTAHERHIDLIGSFNETNAGWKAFLRSRGIEEAFWPECFRFDPERNVYVCPEGRTLVYISKKTEKGKTTFNYRGKHCKDCPSRLSCCPQSTRGRSISRIENDPRVDAFLKKMKTDEAKAIYKQRAEVAEFPNAWIKEKFGLRQFRLRGIVKVGIEALWACFSYNIKLWIRLCWRGRVQAAE